MQVVEKFVSINGEGLRAGELAVFVRFKGCNLKCAYCDTTWANESNCKYDDMTPNEILEYVKSTKVRNVTLTGGEPLLQKDIDKLIKLLVGNQFRVEIETNGAVALKGFAIDNATFTMDYKLASSGMEDNMLIENLDVLNKEDTIKFVSGSREDLDRVSNLITKYNLLDKCHIIISPVFGIIDPKEIVKYMIDNNMNDVRLQIQMHKVIWDPETKGV